MIETGSEGPPPPAPGRVARRSIVIALLIGALGLGMAGGYTMWAMGGTRSGEPVRVIVPEGTGAGEIARLLADARVIRSSLVFRMVARLRGVAGEFKPGAYDLRTGLGVSAAIAALRVGIPLRVFRFTIPEGKTIAEIAAIVAGETPISETALLRAVSRPPAVPDIAPRPFRTLEGFLFPKTYEVVEKTSAHEVVTMLVRQFERETARLNLPARAKALGVTPYEALIIASLVEREARIARDRPLIASVIYNRLRRGRRLQIDATVQYAILLKTGRYKPRLTFDDYKISSPYNTYRIDGLPPAPIASPGLDAIEAALNPAETGFFYYVLCDPAGGHAFAKTSEEFSRLRDRCL